MSIRLRLAAVFTAAAAILFTLGSWAFVAGLSSSLLGAIDTQLAARISTAGRYLPGHGPAAPTARPPAITSSRSSTGPAGCAAAAPRRAGRRW